MKKIKKLKTSKTYTITNVPDFDNYLVIYNRVLDNIYQLEKKYKQASRLRKFDISDHWTVSKTGNEVKFNVLNTMPAMLTIYILREFEEANNYWTNKR